MGTVVGSIQEVTMRTQRKQLTISGDNGRLPQKVMIELRISKSYTEGR